MKNNPIEEVSLPLPKDLNWCSQGLGFYQFSGSPLACPKFAVSNSPLSNPGTLQGNAAMDAKTRSSYHQWLLEGAQRSSTPEEISAFLPIWIEGLQLRLFANAPGDRGTLQSIITFCKRNGWLKSFPNERNALLRLLHFASLSQAANRNEHVWPLDPNSIDPWDEFHRLFLVDACVRADRSFAEKHPFDLALALGNQLPPRQLKAGLVRRHFLEIWKKTGCHLVSTSPIESALEYKSTSAFVSRFVPDGGWVAVFYEFDDRFREMVKACWNMAVAAAVGKKA